MFTKISRYYKVSDVAVPDADGRVLASKDLRLLPEVTGTFRHRVEAGDRLDHLAHKYYSQPLQWWHICDANPDFLSPLALLGEEVIVKARFPLRVSGGGPPPWAALFQKLYSVLGVEDVQVIENVETREQVVNSQTVFENRFSWEIVVTYNQLNVTREVLADQIEKAGFEHVFVPVEMGQLGQEIIIPPKTIG